MRTLHVNLAERGYPIHIGYRILRQPDLIAPHLTGQSVAVVTNETVAPLYLSTLCDTLAKLEVRPLEIILPDGESHKNWQTLQGIFDALLAAHYERNSTLIALGGGVIGDMGGFAAACYQRGMPFIQIPTTLLAQVDSSVGGKTAINHPLGKNMIGAFYQPRLVLADTATLATLPDRELSAGLAEVIKYGLIRDEYFLDWLEHRLPGLRERDEILLEEAIWQSCRHKAEIVAADERETGERALLNLGHTFGHAIETGMGYGVWLHGEAVAAGTVMAAYLSRLLGFLPKDDVLRVEKLFAAAGLPVQGPGEEWNMRAERYLSLMRHDKKTLAGQLRLVLLKRLGEAFIHTAPDDETVMEAIRVCCEPR
ncbi:MAG: 3-dehydroquinate synthase [Zoogloeaceae bacterium]|jgi:3-dehydroquinate synthase|nr:3-dehydroquinate synthase [Zoogloeaceae bacterium]